MTATTALPVAAPAGTGLGQAMAALFSRYRKVLELVARQVTGDPGALTRAASAYRGGADGADESARTLAQARAGMRPAWSGPAYERFDNAAARLGTEITTAVGALRRQEAALLRAADALRLARSRLEQLLRDFDQGATVYLSAARSPYLSQSAVDTLMNRARQFCERAEADATEAARQLANVLRDATTELRGAATTAPAGTPGKPTGTPGQPDARRR